MLVTQTIPILRIFDVSKAFHRELLQKNYPYMRPGLEIAPWKAKLMEVTDPFGNRLRFNEDLK